jgi:hypothetical protein
LEPRFVALAETNFALHRRTWEACGDPLPVIVQGDSRRLVETLGPVIGAACVVSSPPFADSVMSERQAKLRATWNDDPKNEGKPGFRPNQTGDYASTSLSLGEYGQTPGQLGAMKAGDVAAVIGSPPFAGTLTGEDRKDESILGQQQRGENKRQTPGGKCGRSMNQDYGTTTGQLGAMPPGSVAAACDLICGSPPFEGSLAGGVGAEAPHDTTNRLQDQYKERPVGADYQDVSKRKRLPDGTWPRQREEEFYDNLGINTGDTFWAAAREIVQQCHQILRPGGVAVWVLKAFVRKGEIQDFPGDWRRLCESVGFVFVEEIHASLVKKTEHAGLFGEPITTTK